MTETHQGQYQEEGLEAKEQIDPSQEQQAEEIATLDLQPNRTCQITLIKEETQSLLLLFTTTRTLTLTQIWYFLSFNFS
jgi:hypothetical protein